MLKNKKKKLSTIKNHGINIKPEQCSNKPFCFVKGLIIVRPLDKCNVSKCHIQTQLIILIYSILCKHTCMYVCFSSAFQILEHILKDNTANAEFLWPDWAVGLDMR